MAGGSRNLPRTAYFENAAGAEAAIELAIASSLPRLPTVAAAPSNASASAIAVGGESTGSGRGRAVVETTKRPQRPSGPVTFESIGARKRAEQEAARKRAKEMKPNLLNKRYGCCCVNYHGGT